MFKKGDIIIFNREDDCDWNENTLQSPRYLILETRKWFRYTVLQLGSNEITTLDKAYLNKYFHKVG